MMKKYLFLLASVLLCMTACGRAAEPIVVATPEPADPDVHVLELAGHTALLDGEAVEEYDYTWHCDPSAAHDAVEDAPAEYYTGTAPETDAAVYIDSELYYVPALPEADFQKITYDGDASWAAYYTDGEHDAYAFAVLPALGGAFPSGMLHTEAEAAENRVLHIQKAGTYSLAGTWNGQIDVDLGEDAFDDPEAKVTVILNGVEITCTAAPGLLFENAYECDNGWEDRDAYSADVDLSDAGVTVVLADGTENTVSGTNISRMLRTVWQDEDEKTQKKLRKLDGALYSCVSMNITGTGALAVNGGFEGIDSELHLAFSGGQITVRSQDDGINVNEDGVSVVLFDGAAVEIFAAEGAEGDGVDSNGFIVVNDGTVSVNGIRVPDHALDSDKGVTYNGGTVKIDGEVQNIEPGSEVHGIDGKNADAAPGAEFDLAAFKKAVEELPDDASPEDVMNLLGRDAMPAGGTPPEQPMGETPPDPPAPPKN